MRTSTRRARVRAGLMALAAGCLLSSGTAGAATLLWNNPSGGNFNAAANWDLSPGPGTAAPAADSVLGFGIPVTGDVTVSATSTSKELSVVGGQPTLDLDGNDLTLGETLQVFPATNLDQPALTVTNGSGTPATLRVDGTVEDQGILVANGGSLTVQGPDLTVDTQKTSIGVAAPVTSGVGDNGLTDTAVLDGGTWRFAERFDVGASRDGELTVQNGGLVQQTANGWANGIYLGSDASTTGTLTISGAGSEVQSNLMVVGGEGTGSVEVQGGTLDVDNILIGAVKEKAGVGELHVNGPDAVVDTYLLKYGENGQGTLRVSDGTISAHYVEGANNNSTFVFDGGTIDTGSFFSFNGVTIGDGGGVAAELDLTSGYIGGDLVLEDDATVNHDVGYLRVNRIVDSGGTFNWLGGSLRHRSSFTIGTDSLIAQDVTLSGISSHKGLFSDYDVTVDGGSITVDTGGAFGARSVELLNGGAFTYNGGNLALTGGLTLETGGLLGDALTLTADHRLSTGSDGILTIKSGSLLTLDGGDLSVNRFDLDGTPGGFDWLSGHVLRYDGSDMTIGTDGELGPSLSLGADKSLELYRGTLAVTDGTVALEGGSLKANDGLTVDTDAGGAFHFDTGVLDIRQGNCSGTCDWANTLQVGGIGGILGAAGASTVTVGADDKILGDSLLAMSVTDNATLSIEGGEVSVGSLSVDAANGGAVHFGSGHLFTKSALSFGGATGISGAAGAAAVVLNTDDRVSATTATVEDGSTLTLAGGSLSVDRLDVDAGGTLDLDDGTLSILGSDLYVGSSYAGASGTVLPTNTAEGSGYFYEIDDGMTVYVGKGHRTYVDDSLLHIKSGGTLSTWQLSGGGNIVADGVLQVNFVDFSSNSTVSGDLIAEEIAIAAQVTLSPGARLVGQAIIDAQGELRGSGEVNGDLINGGTLSVGESPGDLSVTGFFEQLDTGSIFLEVGKDGTSGDIVHDAISVAGMITLDGELEMSVDTASAGLDPGFDPTAEPTDFVFLTGSDVLGTFASVANRDLGDGWMWMLTYEDTQVSVSAVTGFTGDQDLRTTSIVPLPIPEPGTGLLLGLGLLGLGARRRLEAA